MKANELRIGNLVTFNGKQIIVSWEDVQFIMTSDFEKEYHKPIPLTEEWLLKFGFEVDENLWFTINLIGYSIERDDDISWDFLKSEDFIVNIKYVHQLQNLYFALVGEELKIKE